MIITLRATSGGGKSTIVFTLLDKFPHEEIKNEKGKVVGYKVEASLNKPVYVVGPYRTKCGGTDALPKQQLIADMALEYHRLGGHVILEGLLLSGGGPKAEVTLRVTETGDYAHAFLDTPLEVCIERVKARRAAAGNDKPLNTANTEMKWGQCVSTYRTLKKEGYRVALIDHTRAYDQIMGILRDSE